MTDFVTPRNRSASHVIRGYVYQVDLTVERWLQLAPHQALELECGEDIDHYAHTFTAPDAERHRLLEQIKHRQPSLTLSSTAAVTAMACFIETRHANPSLELFFRFTTNASFGVEQHSPFGADAPALQIWENVRLSSRTYPNISNAVLNIRKILCNSSRPAKVPDSTWTAYREFVNTSRHDELLDLIVRMEWSIANASAASYKPRIQQLLVSSGFAANEAIAEPLYFRLFMYVIKLLSQPGRKTLTSGELHSQIAQPHLSPEDSILLKTIHETIRTVNDEIGSIAQEVGAVRATTEGTHQLIESMQGKFAKLQSIANVPVLSERFSPNTDLPPELTRLSNRNTTVATITQTVSGCVWTALHGSVNTGKTQLAALVIRSLRSPYLWIRLRDIGPEIAVCNLLDEVFNKVVPRGDSTNRVSWYKSVCAQLGGHAVIVLDDLPQLQVERELAGAILDLVHACRQQGSHILSTSHFPPPEQLRAVLGENVLTIVPNPAWTDDEARDLLRAYGAPDNITSPDTIAFLNSIAKQNPVLLTALARYLIQHRWKVKESDITDLLRGEFALEVHQEIVQRIVKTIEDTHSRELLYRLSLALGSFNDEIVRLLAKVTPAIPRPYEHFAPLGGLWVQRDGTNRYVISPLATHLGSHELNVEVSNGCHLALGDNIMQRKELNQWEVFRAIIHYLAAKANQKAAVLMLLSLIKIKPHPLPYAGTLPLTLWTQTPIPTDVDLNLRLYIRAHQLAILSVMKKDVSFLTDDLDNLFDVAENQLGWGTFGAAVVAAPIFEQLSPERACRYLSLGIRAIPQITATPEGRSLDLNALRPERLIWIYGAPSTVAGLAAWCSLIEALPPELRTKAFSSRLAPVGCVQFANRLWLAEAEKPESGQDWDAVLRALINLAQRARSMNLTTLWACAIRSQIVVLAEYKDDLKAAVETAMTALTTANSDANAEFLIGECMGRQYVYRRMFHDAVQWLEPALKLKAAALPTIRLPALLQTARAIGDTDPVAAVEYTEKAVVFARRNKRGLGALDQVKALGELAIANWLNHNLQAAFNAMDKAAEILLATKNRSTVWKDSAVLFGHLLGFLAPLASGRDAPDRGEDGEIYVAPNRGFFLTSNSERHTFYNEARHSVYLLMSYFAEGVCNWDRASFWAIEGLNAAKYGGHTVYNAMTKRQAVPYLIKQSRYREAIENAFESSASIRAGIEKTKRMEPFDVHGTELNSDEVLGDRQGAKWQEAEEQAFILSMLPIAFWCSRQFLKSIVQAEQGAREIAEACRHIAGYAPTAKLWNTMAVIFESIFIERVGFSPLLNGHRDAATECQKVVRAIEFCGIALAPDAPFDLIVQSQASMFRFVDGWSRTAGCISERLIREFWLEYWNTKFQAERFRFRSPNLVAQELARVSTLPLPEQGYAVLIAIGDGLGVPVRSKIDPT